MRKILIILTALVWMGTNSCSNFLDQKSENILTDSDVYSDVTMVNSMLANFYGRLDWGQRLTDEGAGFAYLDEACFSSGGPDNTNGFAKDWWRVYDYELIRDINQFIVGIKSSAADKLTTADRARFEGEARFIRAWTYFCMCRCLGGMPIVDDNVYVYTPGMDITTIQVPRATESGMYDYIINECTAVSALLPTDRSANIHAARANKWAALALKARAAIYAGSIAKYNNLITPNIKTQGGEVGIPASKANDYYTIAYNTAKEIIQSNEYSLYRKNSNLGRNFYEALSSKDDNPEVIWAQDFIYPGLTHQFTAKNLANSEMVDIDANRVTPILNLVEAFEYRNTRDGTLKTTDALGNFIFYKNLADIFANKDARLYGTVIYPGSDFRGDVVNYQAGQMKLVNGVWVSTTGETGSFDNGGNVITSLNGPVQNSDEFKNKSGFNIRKYIEESKDAATRGTGSSMWFVRLRYAEVLMIAAESSMELGKSQSEVCDYINQVRNRAGILPLSQVTLNDIVQEDRVEFAFEDHRWWDLKRWRLAHQLWNGDANNKMAVHYALFPYRIVDPGNPENGKWVFEKRKEYMTTNPRFFKLQNYYNFIDQDWLTKNPKMVTNPFQ